MEEERTNNEPQCLGNLKESHENVEILPSTNPKIHFPPINFHMLIVNTLFFMLEMSQDTSVHGQTKKQNVVCKAQIEHHQQASDAEPLVCSSALKRRTPPQSPRKPGWLSTMSLQPVWVPSSVSSGAFGSFIWKASRQKIESDSLWQRRPDWLFKCLFFSLQSAGLHFARKQVGVCLEPCTQNGLSVQLLAIACLTCTLPSIFSTNVLFSAVSNCS